MEKDATIIYLSVATDTSMTISRGHRADVIDITEARRRRGLHTEASSPFSVEFKGRELTEEDKALLEQAGMELITQIIAEEFDDQPLTGESIIDALKSGRYDF